MGEVPSQDEEMRSKTLEVSLPIDVKGGDDKSFSEVIRILRAAIERGNKTEIENSLRDLTNLQEDAVSRLALEMRKNEQLREERGEKGVLEREVERLEGQRDILMRNATDMRLALNRMQTELQHKDDAVEDLTRHLREQEILVQAVQGSNNELRNMMEAKIMEQRTHRTLIGELTEENGALKAQVEELQRQTAEQEVRAATPSSTGSGSGGRTKSGKRSRG